MKDDNVVIKIIEQFNKLNVKYVLIGSFALNLLLKIGIEWKDIDIYVWFPNLFKEYHSYEKIFIKFNMPLSLHIHGLITYTPNGIPIELIAPIGDFIIPKKIIEKRKVILWKGERIQILDTEAIAVLKAKVARRLDYINLSLLKNKLNKDKLLLYISLLEDQFERKRAKRVLKEVGLIE